MAKRKSKEVKIGKGMKVSKEKENLWIEIFRQELLSTYNRSSFSHGFMNKFMTFITQSHPIASIRRIIFSVSIYMMGIYFFLCGSAFFTSSPKKLGRFSYPNCFRVFSPRRLVFIITFLRTVFLSTFIFIWFTFKCFQTKATFNFSPLLNSVLFSCIPMRFTSKLSGVILGVSSIMTQPRAVLSRFSEARENFIRIIAEFTGKFNFRHSTMLPY